jgi:hypothetical protein
VGDEERELDEEPLLEVLLRRLAANVLADAVEVRTRIEEVRERLFGLPFGDVDVSKVNENTPVAFTLRALYTVLRAALTELAEVQNRL